MFCGIPVISLLFINRVLKATNNKFGEMKFASGAKKKKKEIMCFSFAFESHVARAFKTLSSIH